MSGWLGFTAVPVVLAEGWADGGAVPVVKVWRSERGGAGEPRTAAMPNMDDGAL